ncbi:GNAT family N-acetyltransferase [Fischerella sp. PCC 9605]|uniref:GNAT family N-acetyltransferase n=1 Tax=Fischerella sp. PCC 9605 TaxID=1173024 RepID=UPI00047AAA3C|nr:GNAT family N-acetyltransferase [Fischerella sp. PCC 9605]
MQHPQVTQINQYWANRLQCSPTVFERSGTIAIATEQPETYSRIIVTRITQSAIVQVPPNWVDAIVEELDLDQIVTAEQILATFADDKLEFGWRDFIWYFPPDALASSLDQRVRSLNENDQKALEQLLEACSEEERELGNVNLNQALPVGLFDQSILISVASFIFDGDSVADVGVITHPNHRGQGLGRLVVSELIRQGIECKRIIQYTTQEKNLSSKRLAESLGFWLYAVEEGIYVE